ncbi:MAG: hypothetical protein IJB59_08125 [Oscillospiraceae bacterium]|nr:hypothetical protein [Oscillospiraceae bacterium]
MKFWQSISTKDFGFGVILFALVIAVSLFQPSNKIIAEFEDTEVTVKSSRYTMTIPYEMVASIELVNKPDMGEAINGNDDMILQTGTWRNETWGEYHMCTEIATDNCILIHLTDGRIFVISRRDNEETAKVFEEFQSYLP